MSLYITFYDDNDADNYHYDGLVQFLSAFPFRGPLSPTDGSAFP